MEYHIGNAWNKITTDYYVGKIHGVVGSLRLHTFQQEVVCWLFPMEQEELIEEAYEDKLSGQEYLERVSLSMLKKCKVII